MFHFTLLTGSREILIKLKIFTHVFRILKGYYLVGFGDLIIYIPYMFVKYNTVLLPHEVYQFKQYIALKFKLLYIACDNYNITI